MELAINAVLTVAGLVMLCFGGNWLVSGGVSIARRLGISSMVIGMTVVAYGTSAPELAVSIAAATAAAAASDAGGHSQIILGNVVGSNVANVGMVIGVSAVLVPLLVRRAAVRKELLVMIGASVLLIALSVDGEISRYDGALMISALAVFTVLMYRSIKRQKGTQERDREARPVGGGTNLKSLGLLGVGIALLYAGSELALDNAVKIAQSFDVSEKVIGVTVIAIGTSLPELVTSVIAIRRRHTDIGVGNIIGSNIYNILMIMGIASALAGVTVIDAIHADYAVMIAFSLALLAVLKTGVVSRRMGTGLAAGYAAYLVASLLYL